MTKEEAINYLERSMAICEDDDSRYHNEVLEFIIKALEQEPSKDCISRQSVKDGMIKYGFHAPDMTVTEFVEDILPPVIPTQRWIPVSERLPEESKGVLVYCPERKNIYCACYEDEQWWIFGSYWDMVTSEVVAWMPLPEPYKEMEGKNGN